MTPRNRIPCAVAALVFMMVFTSGIAASPAFAGDARGYKPLPDGMTGIVNYFRHKTSNEYYSDGDRVSRNVNVDVDLTIIRPIHYRKIGGMTGSVQALIPYGRISQEAGGTTKTTSGLFDPTLILGVWPVEDADTQTYVALAEWITAPLGDYSCAHVSPGKNRWGFKTEAALVKGFGDFYVDVTPSYELFTENDEIKEEKDGLFRVETHLSYDFTKTFRMSLDHYYSNGGETEISGVDQNNEEDNHSLQVSMFFGVAPKQQLIVQYLRDVAIENGPMYNQFGLRYLFLF